MYTLNEELARAQIRQRVRDAEERRRYHEYREELRRARRRGR